MESLFLTRDEAPSLWSESIDSQALDYERTNPREYQIVRTHTGDTIWVQEPASPDQEQYPVQDPHLNNKQNKNTNPTISRQD